MHLPKIATFCIAAYASIACADALKDLESFWHDVRAGQASYTQVVTPAPRTGQVARSKTSGGQFVFERPGRFRFDVQRPYAQTIVADGHELWFYDPDLNQVTVRSQAAALAQTPAALLVAGADIAALRQQFDLSEAGERDGLAWVRALPRREGQIKAVAIGLRPGPEGAVPDRVEVDDALGVHVSLRFTDWVRNPKVDGTRLRFVPPAGADVVRP